MLDCKTRDDLINFQGDYILHIMNFTDVPKANIKGRCDILLRCFESKHDGLLNFRDLNYTSVVSGVKGTMNKTLWIEAFDESMDTFLVENQLLD